MTIISNELLNHLRVISQDKLMSGRFVEEHPEFIDLMRFVMDTGFKRASPVLRLPSVLTAIEIAILDNWPAGRPVKGKPNRYGFSLNASAAAEVDLSKWPFHFSGSLMNREAFIEKFSQLTSPKLRNPISADHVEFLRAVADIYEGEGYLFGLLQTRAYGEGTCYPPNHAIVVRVDQSRVRLAVEQASLWTGIDLPPIELAPFVPWFAGNKPVFGKVVLQSRTAKAEEMRGWASKST